ncbi:MAG: hypothetical protein MHM6MM_003054 [Cercozoa sp. M6MM]
MMDKIQDFVTRRLPKYLSSLPLPATWSGWTELSQQQWMQLLPFLLVIAVLVYDSLPKGSKSGRVNHRVKLTKPKVVDRVCCKEVQESANGQIAMCRCWNSKKFPYCDGSHVAHNKKTGDNVGPLLLTRDDFREKKEQ